MTLGIGIYDDPLFWLFPIGASVVSMGAFLLFAAPLTAIAYFDPPRLRRYRIQERRMKPERVLWPSVRWWLLNNLLTTALVVALWPALRLTGVHWGPLPAWWVVAGQVVLFIFLDDFLYYWMHRALHTRWLYKKVHIVHHRMTAPWAIAGHYMHPVEFTLTAALMLLGPVLVGAHVVTLWIWITFRQWEAAEGHCGYQLPGVPIHWFPFYHGPVYHDFHHAKFLGNYAGFLGWADGVFGTWSDQYLAYREARRKQKEGA